MFPPLWYQHVRYAARSSRNIDVWVAGKTVEHVQCEASLKVKRKPLTLISYDVVGL